MELFYSDNVIDRESLVLGEEEARHCVTVLRHRPGDVINVTDGAGTMYEAEILSSDSRKVTARITCAHHSWHSHPYRLTMAVCPTKNNERFEWFVEKSVEIGVDRIVPVIGDRSERKVYKTDRARKIALSAAKQSLKAVLPEIGDPVSVRDFISSSDSAIKLIACCFENEGQPRRSLESALADFDGAHCGTVPDIAVLIGPEGDFSRDEAAMAIEKGFIPLHLGESRLRTETAALVSVAEIYGHYSEAVLK